MKKSDLVAQVAEKAELSKEAASRALHALFDATSGAIAEAVRAGEHVSIPGFGKFKPKTRAARKGRNPQTGAEIDIPERASIHFSVGKTLQDALAGNTGKGAGGKKAAGAKASGKTGGRAGGSKAGAGKAQAAKGSASTGRGKSGAKG